MKKLELLSPAGDWERLRFAVRFGADAVYLGAQEFGMRAAPKNFTLEQLEAAVHFAHGQGCKVYLTLNTTPTNDEADRLPEFLRAVRSLGLDAVIVADLGVLAAVKETAPELELHISTQAGITNYRAARMAYQLGAKRVVLARELPLTEIAKIRDRTPPELELEAFVHGAMCMSVSGRCLLSHYLTGRDGNRGECAQPCRWKYALCEETRPGRFLEIGEQNGGSYILNADDLCTAPFLNLLAEAGVDSFKIEGRAKSFYYVASVTAAYRRALDAYETDPAHFICPESVLDELTRTSHRRYSPGFYFGPAGATQNPRHGGYYREWEVVGVVEGWQAGIAVCTQRGKFTLGEPLEALTPGGEAAVLCPAALYDGEGQPITATPHPMMRFSFPCETVLPADTILRRRAGKTQADS